MARDGSRRAQGGQAIILVAFVMVVLLGFLGLSLDGGRAYLDRRDLQTAVDSAALAAAYTYMNTCTLGQSCSFAAPETKAFSLYANNLHVSDPTCPSGGTSVSCTFSGQTVTITVSNQGLAGAFFNVTGSHTVPVSIMQVLGAPRLIPVSATATAVARLGELRGAATQTLSPAGCGGNNGNSLTFSGTSTVQLTGDVWSNGNISDTNNTNGTVDGNIIDICPAMPPSPVPNFTVTGSQFNGTPLGDPGYPSPTLITTAQSWGSSDYNVVRHAGTYATNPTLGGTTNCFFLDGGVYTWQGGFTLNGGVVSNELRPPDEPAIVAAGQPNLTTTSAALSGTITSIGVSSLGGAIANGSYVSVGGQLFRTSAATSASAGPTSIPVSSQAVTGTVPSGSSLSVRSPNQFWDSNGVSFCGGEFMPYNVGATSDTVNAGTYGVEITSLHWTPYGVASCSGPVSPSCFRRESAPSMCKIVTVNSNQVLKLWISNVPGADAYNLYLSQNGSCQPNKFGYAGQLTTSGTPSNKKVSGCEPSLVGLTSPPSLSNCDLGSSSATFNGSNLCPGVYGASWPDSGAAQDACGALAPDHEGLPMGLNLPNSVSAAGTPPRGDLANENYCVNAAGNAVGCPAAIVPGAILFYIPSGGCLSLQGGEDVYFYTGFQYQRILLYEPGALQAPPANTCQNGIEGGAITSLLGIFYVPGAGITITGNSNYLATIAGGVIAWTANIKGSGGVAITADPSLPKFPKAVQLTQ